MSTNANITARLQRDVRKTSEGGGAPAQDAENPGGFRHIPALDGIRGLAILLVLFHHFFWSNNHTGNRTYDILDSMIGAGYIGVFLFFALSGFLITGILLDTLHIPHFFKVFYSRRALRIFPLYYGFLLVLIVFSKPLQLEWNGWQYYYLAYIANLVLWPMPAMNLQHFNINHFWTLQVEEQFYFVWPFIVYRVRKLRNLIRLSLITAGVVLLIRIGLVLARPYTTNVYLPYWPTFSCVDHLLLGCCLCCLLRTPARAKVLRWAPRVFALCMLALVPAAILNVGLEWRNSFFIPTFGFSLLGLGSASLIAMTLVSGSHAQRFFVSPILRFFGKYSYGLYVYHYSIDGLLSVPIRAFVFAHIHNKAIGVLIAAIVAFCLSIAAALLSYHFYEMHFLKLKKYFGYSRVAAEKSSNVPTVA